VADITTHALKALSRMGIQVSRTSTTQKRMPIESTASDRQILERVSPLTMTSWERLWSLLEAVRYVEEARLTGAFVECGVWRGGSVMAMALRLLEMDRTDRDLWLYDTFEGMTPPSKADVEAASGVTASDMLASTAVGDGNNVWCVAGIDDVQANMRSTGYPESRVHYVQGDVAKTLLEETPEQIALLRLDTDWYESTRAELEILYPRLVKGGVCILDDYGHWQGARKAVDEYFAENGPRPLILPIDFSGRIFVKN
jgi:hypothetical protein